MLSSGVYKTTIHANLRQFGVYTARKKNNLQTRNSNCNADVNLVSVLPSLPTNNVGQRRSYSDVPQTEPKARLPQLMDFPEVAWPSVFKTIRNWVLANMIIRPYFDRDFNMIDFMAGSKQAMSVVSTALARDDYESLNGLVTDDAIQNLKGKINDFTLKQREEIAVAKEDIYFSFPYQIGVMFEDEKEVQKRYVEITMVYHVLRGVKKMKDEGRSPPMNMGMLPEYQQRISICNYRFIREFTKDVNAPWMVNIVNHFKPIDFIKKTDQEK